MTKKAELGSKAKSKAVLRNFGNPKSGHIPTVNGEPEMESLKSLSTFKSRSTAITGSGPGLSGPPFVFGSGLGHGLERGPGRDRASFLGPYQVP